MFAENAAANNNMITFNYTFFFFIIALLTIGGRRLIESSGYRKTMLYGYTSHIIVIFVHKTLKLL